MGLMNAVVVAVGITLAVTACTAVSDPEEHSQTPVSSALTDGERALIATWERKFGELDAMTARAVLGTSARVCDGFASGRTLEDAVYVGQRDGLSLAKTSVIISGAVGAYCPEYRYLLAAPQVERSPGSAGEALRPIWRCHYRPTYNYDWHDDVVCSNGIEMERPYLREWDDYVTRDELMESAAEYQEQLNRR